MSPTPLEVMERLQGLPEHLRAHHRRFIVEAVTDETRAPMIAYYEQQQVASRAAQAWGEPHGAVGFFPPHGSTVYAFAFKTEDAPSGPAWTKAGRGYSTGHGHVALYPSKRPAGRALIEELEGLPKFPTYNSAIDHLGLITDLNVEGSYGGGVGHSDGKLHFSVPMRVGDRHFVSAVNHNSDILRAAEQAAEYLAGDHPEYARSLDYKGDPISWRPGAGWAFLTKSEFDFLVAEARLAAERERAEAA